MDNFVILGPMKNDCQLEYIRLPAGFLLAACGPSSVVKEMALVEDPGSQEAASLALDAPALGKHLLNPFRH